MCTRGTAILRSLDDPSHRISHLESRATSSTNSTHLPYANAFAIRYFAAATVPAKYVLLRRRHLLPPHRSRLSDILVSLSARRRYYIFFKGCFRYLYNGKLSLARMLDAPATSLVALSTRLFYRI